MKTLAFYSYKGGLGRSLLVANLAQLLASCNRRVFVVDLDLEAPGLHYKFLGDDAGTKVGKGLIDYLHPQKKNRPTVRELTHEVKTRHGEIYLMPAGQALTEKYSNRLGELTGQEFYGATSSGVPLYEKFKNEIEQSYKPDYLLLDARTGVTQVGNISLHFLSDIAVCLFSCSEESYQGAAVVMGGVAAQLESAKDANGGRKIFPVISRVIMSDAGLALAQMYADKVRRHIVSPHLVKDPIILPADPTVEVNDKLWTVTGRSLSGSHLLGAYIEAALRLASDDAEVRRHLGALSEGSPLRASNEAPSEPLIQFRIDPAPEPISDRIKRRMTDLPSARKAESLVVADGGYVEGQSYRRFVSQLLARAWHSSSGLRADRGKEVGVSAGSIRWDALPQLFRNGAVDFSKDPFFFSRARQYLLGCLPIGRLSTFALAVRSGAEVEEFLRYRREKSNGSGAKLATNGWAFRGALRELFRSKVIGVDQIAGWADTTAMEECQRAISDVKAGGRPEEFGGAEAILDWLSKHKERVVALDHGNAEAVAKLGRTSAYELEIAYNNPHLIFDFHEQTLPVGFAYPREDEGWGRTLAQELSKLIESGDVDEGSWRDVSKDLKKVGIEALSFRELQRVAARGMSLSEAIEWLDDMDKKRKSEAKRTSKARR